MSEEKKQTPSELLNAERWDRCIENFIYKIVFGCGIGFASFVVTKRPILRGTLFGISTGVGVGIGYTECKQNFESPVLGTYKRIEKTQKEDKTEKEAQEENDNPKVVLEGTAENQVCVINPKIEEEQQSS